jgi:hypothetical protein
MPQKIHLLSKKVFAFNVQAKTSENHPGMGLFVFGSLHLSRKLSLKTGTGYLG